MKLSYQQGFSLVELMVAVTISMLLLGGMISMVVNSNNSYNELTKAGQMLENGRFAMHMLHEDITLAGYYGEYYDTGSPSGSLPDPCPTTPSASSIKDDLNLHIQGYDAPTGNPSPTCINDANHVDGTDILVIRRAATDTIDISGSTPSDDSDDPVQNTIYLQGASTQVVVSKEDDGTVVYDIAANGDVKDNNFTLTDKSGDYTEELREMYVAVYFLSPCSVPSGGSDCDSNADGGDPIPTLKRAVLNSGGTFTVEPLVEGIENMQFDYGVDSDDDGMPDSYTNLPSSTSDWGDVVNIKVHLLARNIDSTQDYTDKKTYELGISDSSTIPATMNEISAKGDSYKRHVFSSTARLVNIGMRREQQ